MLDLLTRYAQDHGLVNEPGFKPKRARWALVFNAGGRLVGVQELGDTEARKNPGRLFERCPDLSQSEIVSAGSGCRHFLLDSAEVVSLFGVQGTEGDEPAKAQAKHDYFVGLLRQASAAIPELGAIADSLSDSNVLHEINSQLEAKKAKSTENVTLFLSEPSPQFLVDREDWHEWWRQFRAGLKKG